MARRITDRTTEALSLYETIRPCFGSQAERAKAIGISRTAIRPWDTAELTSVNESSLQRVWLVAQTCEQLRKSMPESAIGDYLLGSCMADRVMPRLELVLRSGAPSIVVDLARAESEALAKVAVVHIEAFPAGDRRLYDEFRDRARGKITATL